MGHLYLFCTTCAFKHCIDFLNGDYEKQESTEELTTRIISESEEIMNLLNRDGIEIEEVSDYHIYPIADNDTPQLSSDRLEYTLSNGLGVRKEIWNLDEIKEIYENIEKMIYINYQKKRLYIRLKSVNMIIFQNVLNLGRIQQK